MMLVCTVAMSMVTPGMAASPRASDLVRAWSDGSFLTPSFSATRPAAASTPAWRMPPPTALRSLRAGGTG
jgi:hypothetical protein